LRRISVCDRCCKVFYGRHRVWQIERIILALLGLHQRNQQIKPVARRRITFRRHKTLDLLEGST
jgi:hypothetical protein